MEGWGSFFIAVSVLTFLFSGDPDLYDKLFELAHLWADGQLMGFRLLFP